MDDLNERAALEVMGWSEDYKGKRHRVSQEDWDPLHNIAHAWLLVEEMRKKPRIKRHKFDQLLRTTYIAQNGDSPFYESFTTWLHPAAICRAAVSACEKEKG